MLQYNGTIQIAKGRSRHEKHWQNISMSWGELLERLAITTRTSETLAEYHSMPKHQRDALKDVGGFVGGELRGGRRKADTVTGRTLLTLDADHVKGQLWEDVSLLCPFGVCVYSTHSHTLLQPRLRFVVPLSRTITAEEYPAVARMVAFDWGIEYFDDSTYEPHRLMYWPSTPNDGEYFFDYIDGPWLDPDTVLSRYTDWRDISTHPRSGRVGAHHKRLMKKQGDPLEKPGIVGAFCRTYTLTEALTTFLTEEYEPCAIPERYTYRKGSTAAGLVVYDDKFAYSHHGTDLAGSRLCNAFDLVRIHRYGHRDDDAKPDTPINKLPSYQEMVAFARELPDVKKTIYTDRTGEAVEDFHADGDDWITQLDTDAKGNYLATIGNIVTILEHDPQLKGRLGRDEFEHREVIFSDMPWREFFPRSRGFADTDESQLQLYFEQKYKITSTGKFKAALDVVFSDHAVHPVRDYLDGLFWDSVERVDTLLIDYLGAADTPYTRAVTRKMLTAAVARIYEPGSKFDYMLVLVGPQGVGKSYLVYKLGGKWYSDSFTTVQGKEAYEQLQGAWLMEVAEMAGMSKGEVEVVKHFISKQEDRFRVAYGKRLSYFPRQCVFFGTTNNRNCLRDETGNRRFWPVDVRVQEPSKNLFQDFTQEEIDQVWAEAVEFYRVGEPLYLNRELEAMALEQQASHTEEDPKTGIIQEYLELPLPEDWSEMSLFQRQGYVRGEEWELMARGVLRRERVCIPEIWDELFAGDQKLLDVKNRRELHSIMQQMPGWKAYDKGTGKLRFPGKYGPQKAYVRV